jgi:soluble lytic murein transglycosylase
VLYYAALAYQRKGDQGGALRNFDVLLQSYPDDRRVRDALYGKAVSQTRQGNPGAALATLRLLLSQFPDDPRTDDGFWNAALTLEGARNHAVAGAAYVELATAMPASSFAPAALFNAGVNYYLAQDSASARESWNNAVKKYPASQYADSAAYWLGKLAREEGDETDAVKFFQLAAQPPRTYYSFRALDALNQPAPPPSYRVEDYAMHDTPETRREVEAWIASWSGAPAAEMLPERVQTSPAFRRGSEYALLSRALDARPPFQAVNEQFEDDAAALYALALFYKDNNYFSLSIDAANKLAVLSGMDETAQPQLLRELIYPTYFADLIVPYAETHDFDPAIFFGLVRQESGYNPLSFSSAQARGLTQVIPGTGDLIARALNVTDFEQNDLFKPFVSVRFGTYYLGTVLDSFDGNVYYALMGYNGGPGNARRWQRDDLDAAVEMITLGETHLYVRTVIAQYRNYVNIYRDTTR